MADEAFNSYPQGWRWGLMSLVYVYVVTLAAYGAQSALKNRVRSLDEQLKAVSTQLDGARVRQDFSSLQTINGEFDRLADHTINLQYAQLAVAIAAICALLVFVWATWQLTRLPASRWETFGRYAALLLVAILPLVAIVGLTEELSLLRNFCFLGIAIGIERAAYKIAQLTGKRASLRRLKWLFKRCRELLAAILLVALVGGMELLPQRLTIELVRAGITGVSMLAGVYAVLLWQLGASLDAAALSRPFSMDGD